MSTIYSINAETSTSVSATDQFPMYKSSTGRTMKAAGSALQTYILGATSGSSGATVGFYGQTPVVQQSGGAQADILSTAAVSSTGTNFGYATSTQANGIVTLLREIRRVLVASTSGTGLMAGA